MNAFTRAVIRDAVSAWPELSEAVEEWATAYADPAEAEAYLARSLKRDFRRWYGNVSDELMAAFIHAGLKQVEWRKVASYLLERYRPASPSRGRQSVTFSAN